MSRNMHKLTSSSIDARARERERHTETHKLVTTLRHSDTEPRAHIKTGGWSIDRQTS